MGEPENVRAHPHVDYFVVGGWFARRQDALPVLPCTRVSFERAFGLSPEAQVRMEAGFRAARELGFTEVPAFADFDSSEPGVMETWVNATL